MRPYIICHMMSSIDGRIDCDMTEKIGGDEYYDALRQLDCDSDLSGRVTMQMHFAKPEPFTTEDSTQAGKESVYKATEANGYAVAVDTKGKLLWPDNNVDGKPLLVITSQQVPAAYLETLKAQGISWIATGKDGIDLPRANTLIVIDADRLGISQLYQLRGRVGRGSALAHAYFTFKPEKVMTETASKRLQAIMEFTELGSGFKIAMRDLEIRGAGSVLGREQHGHMDKVGYELYAKLLKEELTGEEQTVADLDIKADAYIPESYIEASASRLDCYKQIAEIRSVDDYKRVCLSMEENYGKMPKEVLNLLVIAVLKSYAAKFNIRKIAVSSKGGRVELPSVNSLADKRLAAALDRFPSVRLEMSKSPAIEFAGGKDAQKVMLDMTKFLKFAENNSAAV